MTAVALTELTIVLAAAWAIDHVTVSRMRPHLRHGLWTIVAIRMLLGIVPPGLVTWREASGTMALDATAFPAVTASLPAVPASWWLAAWSIGAIVLAARWAVAAVRVSRRHAPVGVPNEFAARLSTIADRMGVGRLPGVFVDPGASVPYVTGLLKARLVLPWDWAHWPAETLEHALAHELRHIARRDLLAEAFWVLLVCLYWFHPLAHVARQRAHESREMCCDADVSARLGPGYRITLLRVMATMFGEDTPAGATPGQHAWHPALARLHALDRWSAPPPRGHRLVAAVFFVALAVVLLPPRLVVHSDGPAVGVERLLDVTTRQELGMGSLHLRYALLAAEAARTGANPE